MRIHVHVDDELVAELDREVGSRGRSAFVERCVRAELERRKRWAKIWSAAGSISEEGHPWDPDPARYFHDERLRESEAGDR